MKVLILGVNGFIGSALTRRILSDTTWSVCGVDLHDFRLATALDHPRMRFLKADLTQDRGLIDSLIPACDVVLPLAAYALPASYIKDPLGTFELDFEENLRIVRRVAEAGARLIFPSTSEVYGMCEDSLFDEDTSRLVLGPIAKERWIYACSKQLLDRVIWAMGAQGLNFTLFRPFNWFGPSLDDIRQSAPGSARVTTQFLGHLLRGEPIPLVNGGAQQRSFTYVDDGIDGLMRILQNPDGLADRAIFNLGNPDNCVSIREMATIMIEELSAFPGFSGLSGDAVMHELAGSAYYGAAYDDAVHRRPSIENALRLGWSPKVPLRQGLRLVIADALASGRWRPKDDAPPTADALKAYA
ncbi:MAG TPA: bifunctional UDP-4-keto-pentose/UDP-xylose synthase [Phenylobacterium sp.]|uniref:bifunctional UDP-4-keto-pentose/UDP-xylose synthase n=1 Tax=Phenylobacterium sp. TaxID=1871053 RepID=UPI002BB2E83A|nr:bifunctional UDP-4-keto-pentose/UDP-xylose synthase [Phenylobacterium sp.]HXA37968.1 bifunctional UDP-4-keto-pentose/UDP-xylose synthase [Phenylobacterium sp.]